VAAADLPEVEMNPEPSKLLLVLLVTCCLLNLVSGKRIHVIKSVTELPIFFFLTNNNLNVTYLSHI
jgi:hypothetical protein